MNKELSLKQKLMKAANNAFQKAKKIELPVKIKSENWKIDDRLDERQKPYQVWLKKCSKKCSWYFCGEMNGVFEVCFKGKSAKISYV